MPVLATAGHVDHGKTSLLRFLTGMEPSRLAAEKKRGMTMQLGFVWKELGNGQTLGFVDVPGHTDYTKSMLSGICNVDGFLFVIACDDGFMPQTEEHLFILKSLNISNGLVVLTKSDLVSAERLAEVREEAEIRFALAFDREIPVVDFSAVNSNEDSSINAAFTSLIGNLPASQNSKSPKILVDRAFSPVGKGTVVTGTLVGGDVKIGQSLELTPSGQKVTVRGIHCYGAEVSNAAPTSRVALNLPEANLSQVPKGAHLGLSANIWMTSKVDIKLSYRAETPRKLKKPTQVMIVHAGRSCQARMISIDDTYCRLQLDNPEWLKFADRIMVMTAGGDRIIGGAVIADEAPRLSVKKAAEHLGLYSDFDLYEYLSVNLERLGVIDLNTFERRSGASVEDLKYVMEDFEDAVLFVGFLVSKDCLAVWMDRLLELVGAWHLKNPETNGIPTSNLLLKMGLPESLIHAMIKFLKGKIAFCGANIDSPKLSQVGADIKLIGYVPKVSTRDELVERLEEIANQSEVIGHSFLEIGLSDKKGRSNLRRYIEDGKLVRLGEKHVISAKAFGVVRTSVEAFFEVQETASTAALRDHLGLGRKLAIQILEQLDHQKVTVQHADLSRSLR